MNVAHSARQLVGHLGYTEVGVFLESRPDVNYPDLKFSNHGSITILTALNVEAQEWIDTHIAQNDETQYWGGGIVIEPSYAGDILDGIFSDGLAVA
jgi:hypothetical protein